jgi:hypothetical protein
MPEVVIKHKAFRHYEEVPSVQDPDATVLRARVARRGDTVDVRDVDFRRGEAHDAFFTEEELAAQQAPVEQEGADKPVDPSGSGGPPEPPEAFDASDKSVNDLIEWLEEAKPNAPQTISAAGDDPEVAERLLEAEESVTGRQARSTVVEGLERIIDKEEGNGD